MNICRGRLRGLSKTASWYALLESVMIQLLAKYKLIWLELELELELMVVYLVRGESMKRPKQCNLQRIE